MKIFAKHNLFDLFSDCDKSEIIEAVKSLSIDDQIVLQKRFGFCYDGYKSNLIVSVDDLNEMYYNLIPKIKNIILENRNNNVFNCNDLIPCINSGASNEYMCKKFNLTRQELYIELSKLRSKGISIKNKYYSNGLISFKMNNHFEKYTSSESIITSPSENYMKVLAISDLHLGSYKERLDLVNKAFDYCIKNDINIILCCGDFIDGTFSQEESRIINPYDQVEYFLNNYPHDNNILTFAVGGDHDYSVFKRVGLDIKEACKNSRSDIIIPNFNNSDIKIKNDNIHMYHYIPNGKIILPQSPTFLCLHGHSHKFLYNSNGDRINLTIPSLSNVLQQNPSIVELSFKFHKGYANSLIVKHINIEKDEILNGINFDLSNRQLSYTTILNLDPVYKRRK